MIGGVLVYPHEEDQDVTMQPFRFSGAYHHHRVGNNRNRSKSERRHEKESMDWEKRMSKGRARERRLGEVGTDQEFHEIVGNMKTHMLSKTEGRDFPVVYECGYDGTSGHGHRKVPTEKLKLFLAEFLLVGTMSGYNSTKFTVFISSQKL